MVPIRVYLVEDQPRLLRELVRALEGREGLELVGTSMSGEDALAALPEVRPDVLVLDLELPGMDGIEVLARLGEVVPEVEVLVWTAFQDEDRVFASIRGGASGFLLKHAAPGKIAEGIRTVHAGGTVLQPSIARKFLGYFRSHARSIADADCPLSDEETAVLELVGRGLTNREAGEVLDVPHRRIRSHLRRIYAQLQVRTRVEAVTHAVARGWIEL